MNWRVACLLILHASGLAAAPLFVDHDVIDVTLTGPVSALINAHDKSLELPFKLHAENSHYDVDVRIRGNSRLEVCKFPPLRLNFAVANDDSGVFGGQQKLKLVTHCRNIDRAEQDLLEEYLAYRLFNVVTGASLRVRLLRFNYVDTEGQLNEDASPRYGFVLESEEQLALRLQAVLAPIEGVPTQRHDLQQAALLYVFQYLVGNTDWGFVKADYDDTCCHNIILLERDAQVLTVPYDFDRTGLVNARYAHPDPALRIKSVTQRLYRGLCTDDAILRSAINTVLTEHVALLATIRDVPGLSEKNAARAERYLGAFFKLADDPDKFLRRLNARCL